MTYFIYSRATGDFITTTTSVELLKAFSPKEVEVVIY
jgi:hypothetical protein